MITKITKQWLIKKEACQPGIEWFEYQKETDPIKLIKLCFKEDHFDWANWLITRLLTKKELGMYAVFAVEQVIVIFEQEFPEDNRLIKAIEAVKKYIKNPTKENKKAAYAITAIAADIYSTSVAASFAVALTTVAAYDTADFAYDIASNSTAAVSYSDAHYTYDVKVRKKIIDYGIKLLRDKKE